MEREYGVVLSGRSGGKASVKVTAPGKLKARVTVQNAIAPYQVGRFGGGAYTGVYVRPLEDYSPEYRATFITLEEAKERIARDGYVDQD